MADTACGISTLADVQGWCWEVILEGEASRGLLVHVIAARGRVEAAEVVAEHSTDRKQSAERRGGDASGDEWEAVGGAFEEPVPGRAPWAVASASEQQQLGRGG